MLVKVKTRTKIDYEGVAFTFSCPGEYNVPGELGEKLIADNKATVATSKQPAASFSPSPKAARSRLTKEETKKTTVVFDSTAREGGSQEK